RRRRGQPGSHGRSPVGVAVSPLWVPGRVVVRLRPPPQPDGGPTVPLWPGRFPHRPSASPIHPACGPPLACAAVYRQRSAASGRLSPPVARPRPLPSVVAALREPVSCAFARPLAAVYAGFPASAGAWLWDRPRRERLPEPVRAAAERDRVLVHQPASGHAAPAPDVRVAGAPPAATRARPHAGDPSSRPARDSSLPWSVPALPPAWAHPFCSALRPLPPDAAPLLPDVWRLGDRLS